MSDMLYKATKYMNAEDALLAREERPKKKERQEDVQPDGGQKMARTGEPWEDRRSEPPAGKFTSFTPLTAPTDQVLMHIKDEGALTFPGKLKGDPNKRSRDKYCRFHRDHDHYTADCYDLKQQIKALIRQGRLQRFFSKEKTDPPQEQAPRWENERPRPPMGDIRMIVEGSTTPGSSKKACKTYLRMVQNIQLMGSIPKMVRIDNPLIGFSEEDARHLHHPHDNGLVVSIQAGDYNMHRVLVDNSSSADILYYLTFQQMGIDREQLVLTNAPLVGFGGMRIFPLGVITLAITVGDYPQQITKNVMFLVVDCSSIYNVIIGRPTLNSWKTITSTYHLMIKFPTDYGIGELRGDQVAAREYYVDMMEMDDHFQAMSIEEHRTMAEPVERLEDILLDDSRPKRTTKIGTLENPTVRQG
ncbi:uncharacterized protein LOC112033772 [Quercus suber]|uniref:uncharacterized protein LOC112033772 n=1 Tax=Quercus suber TaxID=58331 RepID=UPI000CE26438|nr:uncharacterized protein LOC112033772 [Quercus suber]